jgi:TIR domain
MAYAPRPRGVALGDHAPHLFLSHSSKDDGWTSNLAEELNLCGVDVWLDAWELRVGDDLHERISDAIQKSRFVAVVITKNFSEGKWVKGEVHQALSREKAEDRTVVLPLLASGGEPPPVLSGKKFLDFGQDYFGSLVRLAGLIHDLDTTSIDDAVRKFSPRDLNGCLTALEWAGWNPLHVVGTRMLDEIIKAGGKKHGDVVYFDPHAILSNKGISSSLRAYLTRMSRSGDFLSM